MTVEHRPLPPWVQRQEIRVGVVVAVALTIGLVVWLVAIRGGGSSKAKSTASIPPSAATPDRLRSLAKDVGHPIYWAGSAANTTYELTKTTSGRIFVRYLPKGVHVGTAASTYSFVGTYEVTNAYSKVHDLAKTAADDSFSAPNGGFAVYAKSRPTNIYLVYPDEKDVQIEVYDPSASRARSLIREGRVAPVQ